MCSSPIERTLLQQICGSQSVCPEEVCYQPTRLAFHTKWSFKYTPSLPHYSCQPLSQRLALAQLVRRTTTQHTEYIHMYWRRDSSVSRVTVLLVGRPRIWDSMPGRRRVFNIPRVETGSGSRSASDSKDTSGGVLLGLRRPARAVDNSPPSRVDITNKWSCNFTQAYSTHMPALRKLGQLGHYFN